jgi:hypothetical protein
MKIKTYKVLEQIAPANDWEFSGTYSGRGMFGKTCLSITSDENSPIPIIEEAAQKGITGAKWDSMGMGVVVYWPRLNMESEMDEVELREIDDE